MSGRRGAERGDAGETLIELLIAMSILGITLVAVLGLIGTSIMMSDLHHKQTTAGASVRNYAEAVETYVASGHYDITGSPDYSPGIVGFTPPSGFSASVTPVVCLGDTQPPAAMTCGPSSNVQKVNLTVASSDSKAAESLIVIVRKP